MVLTRRKKFGPMWCGMKRTATVSAVNQVIRPVRLVCYFSNLIPNGDAWDRAGDWARDYALAKQKRSEPISHSPRFGPSFGVS